MPTKQLSTKGQQFVARALLDPKLRGDLAKNTDATLNGPYHGLGAQDIAAIKALNPHEWSNLTLSDVNRRISAAASFTGSTVTT